MQNNYNLYEINTRVWLKRFDTEGERATLDDVPQSYWETLTEKGIEYVWLMGVWKTCSSTIKKYCFEEHLVQNYNLALRDWKKEDVIGSPYSIDKYEINPAIGSEESIISLRKKLHRLGMKLILDFIPNHFSADTSILKENPEIFLETEYENFLRDSHTYFQPDAFENRVFAHGRDPFFPAWQDTIQVNYFSEDACEYMVRTLLNLTKICDGVGCDMAMLALNNVFKNTWGGVLSRRGFIFIAEAYWDLEWELQQLGFDYTYDKKLTDRLDYGYVPDIHDHLLAEPDYQKKSIRFIENHDEKRVVTGIGREGSLAAAVIMSTLRGMHLFYDGQFGGKKIKLPVQLGREPEEPINKNISEFYDRLLKIVNHDVFKKGEWSLVDVKPASEGSHSYKNILAWLWKYSAEKRLVVVNYSDSIASARIKMDVRGYPEEFVLVDVLNEQSYTRSSEEALSVGLFVQLKNFKSHIFAY